MGGEGRIWTREVCGCRETSVVQHDLRILSLTTSSFSDSLNLLTCNRFNFCELHCNQWQEGKHLWRESRNDKGFTALPKDIPFSRREDETLEREMRRKKGEMGP